MEEKKTCETCKHFVRHYFKFGRSFRPLDVGHCTDPRCRDKRVETPACHRYLKKWKARGPSAVRGPAFSPLLTDNPGLLYHSFVKSYNRKGEPPHVYLCPVRQTRLLP